MDVTHVLFDLDGTLTDPGEGITNAVRYSLGKFGIEVKERSELYPFIGPPLIDSYMKYYGMPRQQAEQAVAYYREYYSADGMFENKVYEGIPELLEQLKDAGKKLILATSKPDYFAERILERFELFSYFDFIGAASLDGTRNNKVQVIQHVITECGIGDVSECIMVGDRKYDIEGAHHFGMPCISVLYGYGGREEFASAGSEYVAQTPADIWKIISS